MSISSQSLMNYTPSSTVEAQLYLKTFLDSCQNDIGRFNDLFMRGLPLWGDENVGQVAWAKAVEQYKAVVLSTGNNLGKSHFSSTLLINWWVITRPGSLVLVTAASQNLIASITWEGLRRGVEGFTFNGKKHAPIIPLGVKLSSGFASPATALYPNGSRVIGLSTTTTERLSGLHNPELLVIVEEASGISDEIWAAIDSLGYTKLVVLGNPLRSNTGFHRLFKQGLTDAQCGIPAHQAVKSIKVPSTDSPHSHLEKSHWGIADKTWLESMKRQHGEHSLWYRAHVLAEFPEVNTETLIASELLSRATSEESARAAATWRRAGKGGKVRIACDVGEGVGNARSVIIVRDSMGILEIHSDKNMDINSTASRIAELKGKYQVDDSLISYDAGGSSGSRMKAALMARNINAIQYFGGHSTASFAKNYGNMRTAAAAAFARRLDPEAFLPGLERGIPFHIPMCAEIGEILEELENLRGQLRGDKYQLEDKGDFATTLGRSPDFADAIGQSYWMEARTGSYTA